MESERIKSELRNYLEKETKRKIENTSVDLIHGGYLDSFMIIKLISFIESNFQVNVEVDVMSEESFSTIDILAKQILEWKKKQGS